MKISVKVILCYKKVVYTKQSFFCKTQQLTHREIHKTRLNEHRPSADCCSPPACVRKGWGFGCHGNRPASDRTRPLGRMSAEKDVWVYSPEARAPPGQSKGNKSSGVLSKREKSIRYFVIPCCTTQKCIFIPLWINTRRPCRTVAIRTEKQIIK